MRGWIGPATTLHGYARVPSTDQDLSLQDGPLRAAGCRIVRSGGRPGTGRGRRAELDLPLQVRRAGDTLVVTRIDRLARSARSSACRILAAAGATRVGDATIQG